MKNMIRPLLFVLPFLALATPVRSLQAQPLACGPDDRQCLEQSLEQACGQSLSPVQSCQLWVHEVENHVLAGNAEWRIIAALGYAHMARLSRSTADSEAYMEQSRSILREVLAVWQSGPYAAQAYIGLASLADDQDESIAFMRSALQADTKNRNIPYLLAEKLQARGQSDDYSQAADLYRESYGKDVASWYSAANALRLYSAAGRGDQASEFRSELAEASGMSDYATQVGTSDFAQNLEHANEVLDLACQPYVIDIFGSETCAAGIDNLVAASRANVSLERRKSIEDVAVDGMRMLSASRAGTEQEVRQREYEFGAVLREWIDNGTATAPVFVLYAQNADSDLDESVDALERAVELAPGNGQYRYWLAQGYIEQGRFDEALDNLTIARDTLPENSGMTPEFVDAELRRAESERSRAR